MDRAGRKTSALSAGVRVSASVSAASIDNTTDAESGRYIRPSMPDMPNRGRKTAATSNVAKAIGRPTSTAAARAARFREGASTVPPIRWTTFSTTMIEASTSKPTAIARPPRVIVFRPTPNQRSKMPELAIDSGIVRVTSSAARRFPSKPNSTSTTSAAPISTARPTPPSAPSTRSA